MVMTTLMIKMTMIQHIENYMQQTYIRAHIASNKRFTVSRHIVHLVEAVFLSKYPSRWPLKEAWHTPSQEKKHWEGSMQDSCASMSDGTPTGSQMVG